MTQISEILRGRSDLSAFLVHFTRGADPEANVKSMLSDFRIEARSAHGWDSTLLEDAGVHCVCFTETPLEYLSLLCGEIQGRTVKLSEWGLAFTKYSARLLGVNPIAYVHGFPNQGGGPIQMATALSTLAGLLRAHLDGHTTLNENLRRTAEILLAGSSKMSRSGNPNEWWWEREWRRIGHFDFEIQSVAFGLCPRDRVHEMEAWSGQTLGDDLRWISPSWTVEETIGHLAHVHEDEISWPRQRYL